MRRHPDAAYPRLYLARGLLMRGERLDEALPLALSALGDAVNDRQKAFACFLLADLYNRIGNAASSEEFAARGKELERTAGR
jgi:hypothetical protein